MAITINTNVAALSAQRNLESASMRSQSSLTKLSSGSRVPTAKEDAASLAVGTGLKLDVTALRAAQTNAAQATSMVQIADGAFGEISNILDRMKSLSTTAQSAQLSSTERSYLNNEFTSLRDEIDRIAGSTEFNGIQLLGGSDTLTATQADQAVDANGIVAVALNPGQVAAGQTFEVSFEADTNALTVRNNTTGVSESVTIADITANSGEVRDVEFGSVGVTLTLNDSFNTGADLAADATADITAVAGGSVRGADLDFQVGINSGDSINVEIAAGNYSSLVNGPAEVQASGAAVAAGGNLGSDAGFASFEIDGNIRNAGEFVAVTFDEVNNELSVTVRDASVGGTNNVLASQTIDVTSIAGGITAGSTETLDFSDVGIQITLDSGFDFAAAVAGGATEEFTIAAAAGGRTTADISSVENAAIASTQVSDAVVSVNTARADIGSSLNRLEFAQSNIAVTIENTEAARSTLMDVDVAAEMTKFSSEQVLIQAGVSMLAQANQQPSLLLRLLQ